MTERHRFLIEAARRQVGDAHAAAARRRASGSVLGGQDDMLLESIPGYRLERVIHRGGQGTVYRAIQVSTSRTVALKLMRDRPFNSVADRARFDREVEILGELDHPSIVRIVDSGQAAGRDFLAMDFVDGVPLDRAAYGDPRRALHLLAEVCDAVHAAHLRGVIHRDLKPGNILVDAAGRPRVLDFGLAKRFEVDGASATADSAMTETGQILGSLPWTSPEQAAGDHARIDVRSDVYALGVVLYQLLTRSFPYRVAGPVREVLDAIVGAEPIPPSRVDPQVDDEVETIVLRTLSKEPSRRYQSAGDLARDIRHYLAGELIEAKRDSLPYVVRKQLRRHWLPVAAVAAVAIAVVVGAVAAASQWRRAVDERDLKESQRRRAEAVGAVLHDILASASPQVSRGERVMVADVLDDAVAGLDAGSLAADPDVEAAIRQTLGESYLGLGQL
ncbi:MAG: serine/threonine protein kinase, partial [Phycisphaerales bacterium]|nr:serine/threonine protein kinase [Phycisphaerales bacterium]